jgi:2-amino-4-hydroxy-6-hydroxymethyldihydropteridine diphosphokinase
MATLYLGLGSNLGDRAQHLHSAISLLEEIAAVEALSTIYETPPWGLCEQPAFLNAVVRLQASLSPLQLLRELQRIETQLGRKRKERWGPRTIDLDILFYDDWTVETAELVIPHPLLQERAFVLVPLAEIAPKLCHPLLEKTALELLAAVPGREEVRPWGVFQKERMGKRAEKT